jgi:hypothetical protein
MPVTRSRNGFYDLGTLDQTNTTRFLFGDEDASGETMGSHTLVTNTDDAFPTLRRTSNIVSDFPISIQIVNEILGSMLAAIHLEPY